MFTKEELDGALNEPAKMDQLVNFVKMFFLTEYFNSVRDRQSSGQCDDDDEGMTEYCQQCGNVQQYSHSVQDIEIPFGCICMSDQCIRASIITAIMNDTFT